MMIVISFVVVAAATAAAAAALVIVEVDDGDDGLKSSQWNGNVGTDAVWKRRLRECYYRKTNIVN